MTATEHDQVVDTSDSVLVVSAHAADFVWRAGGVIALSSEQGRRVKVVCLAYGERGESARLWRLNKDLEEIKAIRRTEAESAAAVLGADIEFWDVGDYPLGITDEVVDDLVRVYRDLQPTIVLTHTRSDPYNPDHPQAATVALEARVRAQAHGYPIPGDVIGAPQVLLFEPHQPEQCEFKPDLLLDISNVFDAKRKAMECMTAQEHLWEYYTRVALNRGVQLERNSAPNAGRHSTTYAEAYMRVFPQVAGAL